MSLEHRAPILLPLVKGFHVHSFYCSLETIHDDPNATRGLRGNVAAYVPKTVSSHNVKSSYTKEGGCTGYETTTRISF